MSGGAKTTLPPTKKQGKQKSAELYATQAPTASLILATNTICRNYSPLSHRQGKKSHHDFPLQSDILSVNSISNSHHSITQQQAIKIFEENQEVAQQGGQVAKAARLQLEETTGKSAISPLNAQQLQNKQHELDLDEDKAEK